MNINELAESAMTFMRPCGGLDIDYIRGSNIHRHIPKLKDANMSGYRHTTISLICMSAHKASATRCHLEHQA